MPTQSSRRTRARLACGFGCACCPPSPHLGKFDLAQHADAFRSAPADGPTRPSLATQAAAVDGDRDAPYVDTHVHLEMVLQKLRWYESAPSLLERRWHNLTASEQQCWKLLNFTPSTWDQSGRKGVNPIWRKKWAYITDLEKLAAGALGWDVTTWDQYEWLLPTDLSWDELDETTRSHLAILGETCDSWNEMFGPRQPAGYCRGGDMRNWKELDAVEQHAAARLGFSPCTWDMVEMADVHSYVQDFGGSGFEACITQGCDSESLDNCVKLALTHPQVFAAFGCHPKNAWLYEADNLEERFLAAFQACGKKAIAWGEFGLDFSNPNWWDDSEYRDTQMRVFERQVQLGVQRALPFVLHIREAAEESLRLLQKLVPKDWKAHVHSFHGPSEFVEAVLSEFPNFYFGVAGTVCMASHGNGTRMAKLVPLERMLLETDGPYITPWGTSFNHPGQIPLIGRKVAEVRGCSAAEVLAKTRENTRHVYGI